MITSKSILIYITISGFLPAISAEARTTESLTLMQTDATTAQSAVAATFVSSINDGKDGDSAISVSNLLAAPDDSIGFPSGADTAGILRFYLHDNVNTEVYMFSTADHPLIGFGVDPITGFLRPGGTYTVQLSEILKVIFPDRTPAERIFNGYAWIVADFDAVGGTYVNFFRSLGVQQSFILQPPFGGKPVHVP